MLLGRCDAMPEADGQSGTFASGRGLSIEAIKLAVAALELEAVVGLGVCGVGVTD
jgi:hypothetical protein